MVLVATIELGAAAIAVAPRGVEGRSIGACAVRNGRTVGRVRRVLAAARAARAGPGGASRTGPGAARAGASGAPRAPRTGPDRAPGAPRTSVGSVVVRAARPVVACANGDIGGVTACGHRESEQQAPSARNSTFVGHHASTMILRYESIGYGFSPRPKPATRSWDASYF